MGHTPDVLTDSTADLAVALMLGIARRLVEGDALVRRGDWTTWGPDFMLGRDLHGATVGIVGMGRIGSAVARRLEGFGVRVLHTGRSGGAPLGELLESSDFVTLHCPLTAGDARPDRRGGARAHEGHGLPGEHRPRADRGHRRADRGAHRAGGSRARRST